MCKINRDYIIVDGIKYVPAKDQTIDEQPCLWDSMPETSQGSGTKIGHLSCPCTKCSPRC